MESGVCRHCRLHRSCCCMKNKDILHPCQFSTSSSNRFSSVLHSLYTHPAFASYALFTLARSEFVCEIFFPSVTNTWCILTCEFLAKFLAKFSTVFLHFQNSGNSRMQSFSQQMTAMAPVMLEPYQLATICVLLYKWRKRKSNHRFWVHPIKCLHLQLVEYHCLVTEKHLFLEDYYCSFRMNPDQFDHVLSIIGPKIFKEDSQFHRSIRPEQKLAVTLRYCFYLLKMHTWQGMYHSTMWKQSNVRIHKVQLCNKCNVLSSLEKEVCNDTWNLFTLERDTPACAFSVAGETWKSLGTGHIGIMGGHVWLSHAHSVNQISVLYEHWPQW